MCDVNKSEETNMLNTTKMKQQATLSPPFLPAPPAPQTEFRFGSIETLIDSRQQHHHEHQQQQQNPSEGRGRILQQLPATVKYSSYFLFLNF
jgi:hypothetical protein